ncbi:MAG: MAPEG family protein [Pseudomonadota bacterium]
MTTAIFGPMLALMVLTVLVWTWMYHKRLSFILRNKVRTRDLKTPMQGAKVFPEDVVYPGLNLSNLFELPVLFYALCLYLYVAGDVDQLYVILAWAFVAGRALHSMVHATVNNVNVRFIVYMLASFVLWAMLGRAVYQYLSSVL